MCQTKLIPTNLDQVFGDNYLAQDIYIYCLLHARNDDNHYEQEYSWTLHSLQKWQWVFWEEQLAKRFRCGRNAVRSALNKLEKLYNKLELKKTNKGTVYTVIWYDDIVNNIDQVI